MKKSTTIKPYLYEYHESKFFRVAIRIIDSTGKMKTVAPEFYYNTLGTSRDKALKTALKEYDKILSSKERKTYEAKVSHDGEMKRYHDQYSLDKEKILPFRGFSLKCLRDQFYVTLRYKVSKDDVYEKSLKRSIGTHGIDGAIEELNTIRERTFGVKTLTVDELKVLNLACKAQIKYFNKHGIFDLSLGHRYQTRYLNSVSRKTN